MNQNKTDSPNYYYKPFYNHFAPLIFTSFYKLPKLLLFLQVKDMNNPKIFKNYLNFKNYYQILVHFVKLFYIYLLF